MTDASHEDNANASLSAHGVGETPLVDETPRAYRKAIDLLGRRDHSEAELRRKLSDREFSVEAIDDVIVELKGDGYLDDVRYALTLAEQRMARGYGPLAIRARLAQRGISSDLAADALTNLGADWEQVALEALERRFDAQALTERSARQESRVARFLQSRGFSGSVALRALESARRQISADSHPR